MLHNVIILVLVYLKKYPLSVYCIFHIVKRARKALVFASVPQLKAVNAAEFSTLSDKKTKYMAESKWLNNNQAGRC